MRSMRTRVTSRRKRSHAQLPIFSKNLSASLSFESEQRERLKENKFEKNACADTRAQKRSLASQDVRKESSSPAKSRRWKFTQQEHDENLFLGDTKGVTKKKHASRYMLYDYSLSQYVSNPYVRCNASSHRLRPFARSSFVLFDSKSFDPSLAF